MRYPISADEGKRECVAQKNTQFLLTVTFYKLFFTVRDTPQTLLYKMFYEKSFILKKEIYFSVVSVTGKSFKI